MHIINKENLQLKLRFIISKLKLNSFIKRLVEIAKIQKQTENNIYNNNFIMDYSQKFEKKNEFFLNNYLKNTMDFLNNFSNNADKDNEKIETIFKKYKDLKSVFNEVN